MTYEGGWLAFSAGAGCGVEERQQRLGKGWLVDNVGLRVLPMPLRGWARLTCAFNANASPISAASSLSVSDHHGTSVSSPTEPQPGDAESVR